MNPPRVLIVDDHDMFIEMAKFVLTAAGFDGYIAKPVDVMTLAAEVRFWLEGPDSSRRSPFVWP